MSKRLLICFAHPDDESFGIGALIAKYIAEGVEVTLICATNGDVGSVDQEQLQVYDSVASLRLAELDCAAKVLGFKEVITLGYRDSGMMGSVDNQRSDCLWQAPLESVAAQISDVMRRIRPQVVITFDPFGGYGHPDHIKIHQATRAAFHAVQTDPVHPQKMYYPAFPRALVRLGVRIMKLTGHDPRHVGTNHDLDLEAIRDTMLPTHARVNVALYYEVGQRAAACHASQGNPQQSFLLARLLMWRLMKFSAFTRAEPPPTMGEPLEKDLFAGVTESLC